ncbi:LCP family protein [Gordonia sp. DT30]|uniref:LCP family protein n=1 Tax=Gordonia sp. DT30 TaxID=3416546 RepID=UPI003CECA737
MSRWTRNKGTQPGDGDDGPDRGDRRRADDNLGSGSAGPESGGSADANRLREPRSADRFVRGRDRLTVRQLMEQMNAAESQSAAPGAADDDSPTQAIPTSRPRLRRPRPAAGPTAAARPPQDDAPTEAIGPIRGGTGPDNGTPAPPPDRYQPADVTQKIPPVTDPPTGVDLSDQATARRVSEESRAQGTPIVPGPVGEAEPSVADDTPVETTEPAEPTTSAAAGPPLQRTPDLTAMARSQPRRVPPRGRRQIMRRNVTVTCRILVTLACVVALVGTGFVWGYLKSVNGNWRNIMAVNTDDANIRNKNAQYGDENYLIVGTDTRSGKNGDVGAGTTADAEGARSDTVILVNIPADRSRVVAVSFPRDLQVDRPQCQQWNNDKGTYGATLDAENQVKLNSVYAFGGPQCLVRVITQMSGLRINHFIGMDFAGFEKVVNAVGGVEVCSTQPIYDYELGQILRKPGKQKLTGGRALNYVRARMVSTEGNGDYGRIKRQQLFMSSLLRSSLSSNVLTNPSKLNSIVNTFIQYSYVDNVNTESLLKLAESMQGIEAGRVSFITVPTTGTATDGSNNELPNTDAIDAIFNAIIDDRPLPGEKADKSGSSSSSSRPAPTPPPAPSRVSATAQNPGNVELRVLNGTGRSGVASEVSDQMYAQGFNVQGVADASENRSDTVIRYGTGSEDSAATVAEMFPGASIQLDRTVRSGVEVILGSGFDGSVGTAPAVGTTLSAAALPPASNTSDLPNDLAITNAGDTTCS